MNIHTEIPLMTTPQLKSLIAVINEELENRKTSLMAVINEELENRKTLVPQINMVVNDMIHISFKNIGYYAKEMYDIFRQYGDCTALSCTNDLIVIHFKDMNKAKNIMDHNKNGIMNAVVDLVR